MEDLYYQTISIVQGQGYVSGVIKQEDYKKFCDKLLGLKKKVNFTKINSINGIEVQND